MAESDRLREAILQNRRAHGLWYTSLAHYATSTNLLARVDDLIAEAAEDAPVSKPSRAVNEFMRAEALASRVVRDAMFEPQLALGPFSVLQPPH